MIKYLSHEANIYIAPTISLFMGFQFITEQLSCVQIFFTLIKSLIE